MHVGLYCFRMVAVSDLGDVMIEIYTVAELRYSAGAGRYVKLEDHLAALEALREELKDLRQPLHPDNDGLDSMRAKP